MKRIFLLDAVNYLFRSYYALGAMTNERGESTNALYGFIRSLQKVIKDFSPDHLVAVFDGPDNKKSRREVYAEYKMHRKGAPEDLFPQFEWAAEFCDYAGIPLLSLEGVEADDTLASIALWAESLGAEVFICSSDKDLMQLVRDRIKIINVQKDNLIYDAEKVKEIYGVRPDQMLDLLSMMGDASDNIPGLPGFGPKTAATLLQEFGTLDEILAHPEKVKGKKQETLRTEKETALLSRKLATLDTEMGVPKDPHFYQLKEPQHEKLSAFYRSMNFQTLLRELESAPRKKKKAIDRKDYQLIDNKEDLRNLFLKLSKADEFCIDTETTSTHPREAELVGVGFSVEEGEAFYLPCNGNLGQETAIAELKSFFEGYMGGVYGHNIKYDWHVLQKVGIDLQKISFDTILASYLINPGRRAHGLDALALEYLNKSKIPIETLLGKGKQLRTMREVPITEVQEYCCEDADVTVQLKELFEEELKERNLEKLFLEMELPLLPILAKMERYGIFLDAAELNEYGKELVKELDLLKNEIFQIAGEEFNLNSPQQLSKILFEKLNLPLPRGKRTATATGAQILEQLISKHPIASLLLEYRMLEKMRSTYVESLPKEINASTGRIHCTFNQSVTATGRLSCQNPNLQNIPIRGVCGSRIRSCFKPHKPGWSFLSADYSQIELRLLAHFSEDEELIRVFNNGEDIHTYTASLVCGIPINEVTEELRGQAKAVNFGILYGQSAFGLSQQTGMPFAQASQFIKTYFERYPKVSDYLEECKKQVRKEGFSKTLFGRIRPIPEIDNKNPTIRSAAERLATNTPLQGTAADLIKRAMISIDSEIDRNKFKGAMILQIHDELIFEIPDEEVPAFGAMVREKMSRAAHLKVPIEVSLSVGKNWNEC